MRTFPPSCCFLTTSLTNHTRPHVERVFLTNLKLSVNHGSLTLISKQQRDTSKGLCYVMRACNMFKTVCECAHMSTLWCFGYAKEEESCSSQPERLMLKWILKSRNYNINCNRNVFYISIIHAQIICNECA